jgi:hypothetical protein
MVSFEMSIYFHSVHKIVCFPEDRSVDKFESLSLFEYVMLQVHLLEIRLGIGALLAENMDLNFAAFNC